MTDHKQADQEAQRHPEGNAPDRMDDPKLGIVVDDGIPAELENDKMVAEDILREQEEAEMKNVNDEPGFEDGRLGGSDGDIRGAELHDMESHGEAHGGAGARRSGGMDGGPERRVPLPGDRK